MSHLIALVLGWLITDSLLNKKWSRAFVLTMTAIGIGIGAGK
jgi:hypothetical protein